jgi:hypothetical protein
MPVDNIPFLKTQNALSDSSHLQLHLSFQNNTPETKSPFSLEYLTIYLSSSATQIHHYV